MEALGKTIRGICSIPLVGGFVALLIGLLPILLLLPFHNDSNKYLLAAVGGLLIAGWCFFLTKRKIINIVTPVLPIPFWCLGLLMSVGGVYQHIAGPL